MAAGQVSLENTAARTERRNGLLFFLCFILSYLPAPVIYAGGVQAALCDKLGANAFLSNLPAAGYLLGNIAPLVFARYVPFRLEQSVLVWSSAVSALLLSIVGTVLVLPFSSGVRILAVILESLLYGLTASAQTVYLYQCLNRGTAPRSRAGILKLTFTLGPMAAVVGSLGSQWILNHGVKRFAYPFDFGFLYFFGAACMAVLALAATRFQLVPIEEERRPGLFAYLCASIREFRASRPLSNLWLSYSLWYASLAVVSNLSLYVQQAIGREPRFIVGAALALRFSGKALAGFIAGSLAQNRGFRAPLIFICSLLIAVAVYALGVSGYAYFLVFCLLGASELGGVYFPNYGLLVSRREAGVRTLSILTLSIGVAGVASTVHGALTDYAGFWASFLLTGTCAVASLLLIFRVPRHPETHDQTENVNAILN